MKQFLIFVKKEFIHVFRDKKTLLMLFGLPIVQIILFGFALTNEIKNSKIIIVDYSKDIATQQIIDRMSTSNYFEIEQSAMNYEDLRSAFKRGKIKAGVIFPPHFNEDLLHGKKTQLQI